MRLAEIARFEIAYRLRRASTWFHTNVLNEYWSPDEVDAAAVEYEKTFRKYEDAPQPMIVDATLRVDIHPERGTVDLNGTYPLVNRTDKRSTPCTWSCIEASTCGRSASIVPRVWCSRTTAGIATAFTHWTARSLRATHCV
jgi:hypothetical protein